IINSYHKIYEKSFISFTITKKLLGMIVQYFEFYVDEKSFISFTITKKLLGMIVQYFEFYVDEKSFISFTIMKKLLGKYFEFYINLKPLRGRIFPHQLTKI